LADIEECKKAAQKAMNLLLRQDRTKKELTERLYRAGFSEEASAYALEYVESFGYIDDRRYAENYLIFHKAEQSAKELRFKMIKKGVPPEILSEVLFEYTKNDEETALRAKLEKKLRGRRLSDMDFAEKNKIIAYLTRKGFSFTNVTKIMREIETQE
jgi:regulatory protein